MGGDGGEGHTNHYVSYFYLIGWIMQQSIFCRINRFLGSERQGVRRTGCRMLIQRGYTTNIKRHFHRSQKSGYFVSSKGVMRRCLSSCILGIQGEKWTAVPTTYVLFFSLSAWACVCVWEIESEYFWISHTDFARFTNRILSFLIFHGRLTESIVNLNHEPLHLSQDQRNI